MPTIDRPSAINATVPSAPTGIAGSRARWRRARAGRDARQRQPRIELFHGLLERQRERQGSPAVRSTTNASADPRAGNTRFRLRALRARPIHIAHNADHGGPVTRPHSHRSGIGGPGLLRRERIGSPRRDRPRPRVLQRSIVEKPSPLEGQPDGLEELRGCANPGADRLPAAGVGRSSSSKLLCCPLPRRPAVGHRGGFDPGHRLRRSSARFQNAALSASCA